MIVVYICGDATELASLLIHLRINFVDMPLEIKV